MAIPLVSIIMPIRHGENCSFLKEAVNSILNQTFQDFEFIIVNDGNDPNIKQILSCYHDNRITVLPQEQQGIVRACNRAFKLSQGKYLTRMDSDDISLPARLLQQVEFLENNPNIGLLGTWYETIPMGNIVKTRLHPVHLKKLLPYQNQFCQGSVMFRRVCMEKAGLYHEEFEVSQDYDLWLRISEHFTITNLPQILYQYRIHPNNVSVSKRKQQRIMAIYAQKCARARRKNQPEPKIKWSASLFPQWIARKWFYLLYKLSSNKLIKISKSSL